MGNDYSTPGPNSQGAIRLQIILQPFSAYYARGLGISCSGLGTYQVHNMGTNMLLQQGIVSTGSSL